MEKTLQVLHVPVEAESKREAIHIKCPTSQIEKVDLDFSLMVLLSVDSFLHQQRTDRGEVFLQLFHLDTVFSMANCLD